MSEVSMKKREEGLKGWRNKKDKGRKEMRKEWRWREENRRGFNFCSSWS
jgi:hypothetical protein